MGSFDFCFKNVMGARYQLVMLVGRNQKVDKRSTIFFFTFNWFMSPPSFFVFLAICKQIFTVLVFCVFVNFRIVHDF